MSPEQTQQIFQEIANAAAQYGVDPLLLLKIANAESGFDPNAKAYKGTSSGLFMFNDGTWAETESGKAGLSRNDPTAAALEAAKAIANGEIFRWYASVGAWGGINDIDNARFWANSLDPATKREVIANIERDWAQYGGNKPTVSGRSVEEAMRQYVSLFSRTPGVEASPTSDNPLRPTMAPTPIPTPMVAGYSATRKLKPEYQRAGVVEQIKAIPEFAGEMVKGAKEAAQDWAQGAFKPFGSFLQGVDSPYITGAFGATNPQYWGKYAHEGTDFRAAERTPVIAPAGWVVDNIQREDRGVYGKNIILRNPKTGERLQFAHLNDINNMLQVGSMIDDRTVTIGLSGKSGRGLGGQAYDPHLHVNYWDETGKRKDVSKVMSNWTRNAFEAVSKGIVKPVQAAEREFGTTVVKTPPTKQPTVYGGLGTPGNQIIPPKRQPTAVATNQIQPLRREDMGGSDVRLINRGESLSKIAKEYNTSWQEIAKLNPQIKDPNKIYAGDVLYVPPQRQTLSGPGKRGSRIA